VLALELLLLSLTGPEHGPGPVGELFAAGGLGMGPAAPPVVKP